MRRRLSSECEVIAIGSGPVADGCARGGRPVGSPRASAGTGACPEPAADETGGRDRAARGRGAGRPADHRRHAAERAALLHPAQHQAGRAGRAPARGQRRLRARGRRSARPRPRRRAHGVQRHAPLSEAGHHLVPAVDRDAVRRARQRQHQLRPDRLPAADSDRRRQRHRSLVPRARGLGHRRHVRGRRDRQGARRRPRGVAPRPRRRRPPAAAADAGPAQGIALRRAPADRDTRQHPHLRARAPEAVLPRLVPARPDGGDRGR